MIIDSIGYRVKVFLDFRALSFYKKRKNRVYACLDEGGGQEAIGARGGEYFLVLRRKQAVEKGEG